MCACRRNLAWANKWWENLSAACMVPAMRVPYGRTATALVWLTWALSSVSSPCCFTHHEWNVKAVVHGDDFTAVGSPEALDKYEAGMQQSFDCKLKGRLGLDPEDCKEMRVLNRIVRITESGVLYEADPRHAEMTIKAFHLENGKSVVTPGLKTHDPDAELEKMDSDADAAAEIHRISRR